MKRMYGGGDCEVLSSIGGSMTTDLLYGSQIQNSSQMGMMPSFASFSSMIPSSSYNPFSAIGRRGDSMQQLPRMGSREEELDSGSGSGHVDVDGDATDNDENEEEPPPPKKGRYHRHTPEQIAEMEALFKECPHPDDSQRTKLSKKLELKPRQVKFWFQNRRTQMKAQHDRAENQMLRQENENLKAENNGLRNSLKNLSCPSCGGQAVAGQMSVDEQNIRIENARLKEELERVSVILARYRGDQNCHDLGQPQPLSVLFPSSDLDMNAYAGNFPEQMGAASGGMIHLPAMFDNQQFIGGNVVMEDHKPLLLEYAMSARDELVKICLLDAPLWIRKGDIEQLNIAEHAKLSSWAMSSRTLQCPFRVEATRESALVIMNSINLVDTFLDANKWMDMFPSIVSRARTLQIVSTGGSGNSSGSLHLMYAEMHALSPLIATREAQFFRYCQQNVEEGIWTIVDFPIDGYSELHPLSGPRYRRRPSGCIIQDMPNGYSRVIWVEHAEVEDKHEHQVFADFVISGMAFGAQRWVSALQQQCERFAATLISRNVTVGGVIPTSEARRNVMKLAQRMIKLFCFNSTTSGGQAWTAFSNKIEDSVRVTSRNSTEPGQPTGVILCAVATIWLPFHHRHVFEFLRDERCRSQIEIVSSGNSSQEIAHIAKGSHPGNAISLLRASTSCSQSVDLLLQESSTDQSGSLVVYSSITVEDINQVMTGQNQTYIPISPSGFVITPVSSNREANMIGNGKAIADGNGQSASCLLTVGLQELASTVPSTKVTITNIQAIKSNLNNWVTQIEMTLRSSALVRDTLQIPGTPDIAATILQD